LSLTEAGHALLPAARRMREGAQELALALAARDQSLAGTVRLTASDIVSTYFLPPVLHALRQRYPEVQIELVVSNEQEDLHQRSADIALRMVRPEQEMLVARKLSEWPVAVFAHRDYIARRGLPQMGNVMEHDWLGYDRSDRMLRGFAAAGTPVPVSFFGLRCDNQVVIWESMRAGMGLAVSAVALGERDPAVQRVLPELLIEPLQMWLTAHRELRDTPRLRVIYDALATAFARPD